jgi:hypothetical protein
LPTVNLFAMQKVEGSNHLQPLRRNPGPERDFVVLGAGRRSVALGSVPPNEASKQPNEKPNDAGGWFGSSVDRSSGHRI